MKNLTDADFKEIDSHYINVNKSLKRTAKKFGSCVTVTQAMAQYANEYGIAALEEQLNDVIWDLEQRAKV